MHQTIKCPHCNEPVSVDLDYSIYYHEECGNDILLNHDNVPDIEPVTKPDRFWPLNTLAHVVIFLLHYGLENEVDCMNEDDMDDWILGATDAEQLCYNTMHPHDKQIVNEKVNAMLEVFFQCDLPQAYGPNSSVSNWWNRGKNNG